MQNIRDSLSNQSSTILTPSAGFAHNDGLITHGYHHLVVKDEKGGVVFEEVMPNLVTTAGKAYLLNTGLAAGAAISTWFLGLIVAQSTQNTGAITSSTTALTVGSSVTTQTGQFVTIYGAGASGANLATTITTGATSTSQTVANAAGTTVSNAITVFGPTFAAADTMASHANWTEIPSADITQGTRQGITFGTTATNSITNGTAVTYNMASSLAGILYLYGVFIVSNSTLQGTTGTLFSEAVPTVGAVAVQASYTVQDTYTLTLN